MATKNKGYLKVHETVELTLRGLTVPIFIKRQVNEWEYVGDYKAVSHSTDAEEIAAHHKGSITPLNQVARVIFLQRSITTK